VDGLSSKQSTTNALVKAVVDDFANGDARTMAQERVQTVLSAELQLAIPKRATLAQIAAALQSSTPKGA
jgi:hypothetical protein